MATTMLLRENVLTDDILRVADKGKCFGRRDYKCQVVYYTYANEWSEHKHVSHARTVESAIKRYERIKGKLDEETLSDIDTCLALAE